MVVIVNSEAQTPCWYLSFTCVIACIHLLPSLCSSQWLYEKLREGNISIVHEENEAEALRRFMICPRPGGVDNRLTRCLWLPAHRLPTLSHYPSGSESEYQLKKKALVTFSLENLNGLLWMPRMCLTWACLWICRSCKTGHFADFG